jgi:predicted RNA-binding Zn-ribbon protein involved in translation (DUF1610 family)
MKLEEQQVEVECPKCKTKSMVKTNTMFDTLYSCEKCGEVITVKKMVVKKL